MKKILIIDDDKDILDFIKFHIEKNYEVIIANNGKEGIKKIKLDFPDLVLTDIIMPEMEGIELIRQIRKIDKNVPIIVMSGDSMGKFFLKASLKLGASDFLTKPFGFDKLDTAIKKYI